MAGTKKQGERTYQADDIVHIDATDGASSNGGVIHPGFESDIDVDLVTAADFDFKSLKQIYRTMLSARRLDQKMLTLLKQGKGFFHIGSSGHEAAQAAVAIDSRPGYDWFCPYYRDLCTILSLGMTPREALLAHLAKADDPNSGGRQMPEHFGSREKHIMTTSSSVGAQFLPALGFGMAVLRDENDAYVYCSCGDGATSQGDFHEALNWSARMQAPILFFVQDNKYAISVPSHDQTAGGTAFKLARGYEGLARARVDGTDFFKTISVTRAAINHIRAGNGPVCLVADVVRLLPHSSSDDHAKYRSKEELEKDRQIDPIARFEVDLIEAGVITEDEIVALKADVSAQIDADTQWAQQQPDPDPATATTHVFFEGDDGLDFRVKTKGWKGEPVVMVDAINHALAEEMERDPRVLIYGEDVAGNKGGVFTATRNLTSRFGNDRCFNSPLAEASIVGTAVGLSGAGFMPVVEIQFADYIWPAMQHLRNQVAPFRYRSKADWECPMVIRVPCGGYIHGGLCHSQNIESIFGHTPGLKVAMPSSAADAKGLLKAAIRMRDPVLFLEHKALYRAAAARSIEPGPDYLLPFGEASVITDGSDLTVVTYGMMVHKCVTAGKTLAREGVSIEIIDVRSIVPLDSRTILDSVRKTGRILIVHEDHEFIGFGAEIAAQVADHAFHYLDAPVKRLAGKFTYVPFADPLERAVLPQDNDVVEAMRDVLSY